jgi:uncharacterized repeat protein (TIGR04076 family)
MIIKYPSMSMSGMNELKITVVTKYGECPHKVGDSWQLPYALIHPKGLCHDAHYALLPYLGIASAGGKSWEKDGTWLIHCPSKKGVVFKIERLDEKHVWPKVNLIYTHDS